MTSQDTNTYIAFQIDITTTMKVNSELNTEDERPETFQPDLNQ